MRTIRSIPELRAHVARARTEGRSIGLVPTMGAFHAGHESLMRAARAGSDEMVVSLFVNPAQFNDPRDLAAYHAAASIAANFLVTLEGAAERLAATAGVPRELLVPLARAALENWAEQGAEQALTGPVARGDEATIARQRAAIEERAPDLLDSFDALVAASRVVIAS